MNELGSPIKQSARNSYMNLINSPGPGMYDNTAANLSPKIAYKFGTKKRFNPCEDSISNVISNPGPGTYEYNQGFAKKHKKKRFGSTMSPPPIKTKLMMEVYGGSKKKIPVVHDFSRNFVKHNKPELETLGERWSYIGKIEGPGPAYYLNQDYQQAKKTGYSFGLDKKEFYLNKLIKDDIPGPGAYTTKKTMTIMDEGRMKNSSQRVYCSFVKGLSQITMTDQSILNDHRDRDGSLNKKENTNHTKEDDTSSKKKLRNPSFPIIKQRMDSLASSTSIKKKPRLSPVNSEIRLAAIIQKDNQMYYELGDLNGLTKRGNDLVNYELLNDDTDEKLYKFLKKRQNQQEDDNRLKFPVLKESQTLKVE